MGRARRRREPRRSQRDNELGQQLCSNDSPPDLLGVLVSRIQVEVFVFACHERRFWFKHAQVHKSEGRNSQDEETESKEGEDDHW